VPVDPTVAPDGSPVELYLRISESARAAAIDRVIPRHARVLDLGCGPGRVAGPLVDAGHAVTGVDNSPAMLAHAAVLGVETVEAELVGLSLGRRFDVVLLLSHFVNEADPRLRDAFWTAAADHVAPGGLVVVERFTPAWVAEAEPSTNVVDGIEIELHDLDRRDGGLAASITYRIEDRSFTQSFVVIALDDDGLAEEARGHGLTFERTLDDDGKLVLLRADDDVD
jgi:SAM-dependent methyltransferase